MMKTILLGLIFCASTTNALNAFACADPSYRYGSVYCISENQCVSINGHPRGCMNSFSRAPSIGPYTTAVSFCNDIFYTEPRMTCNSTTRYMVTCSRAGDDSAINKCYCTNGNCLWWDETTSQSLQVCNTHMCNTAAKSSYHSVVRFDKAVNKTFDVEKGFVIDIGGPTNHGITQTTLQQFRGRNVTVDEVKALTKSEAREIYEKEFWEKSRAAKLPVGMDIMVFDFTVNAGLGNSAELLQSMVGAPIDRIGGIGPETRRKLDEYVEEHGVRQTIIDFRDRRIQYHTNDTRAEAKKYVNGWINRTNAVAEYALENLSD